MVVQIYLRPADSFGSHGALELRESNQVELATLSDAAGVLVKLHEFFEEVKKRGLGGK